MELEIDADGRTNLWRIPVVTSVAMGGNFVDLDTYRGQHSGFNVNAKMLEERRVAVAVRKGDADVLQLVNETIDDLKKSGELKRMTEKWHLPYLLPAG